MLLFLAIGFILSANAQERLTGVVKNSEIAKQAKILKQKGYKTDESSIFLPFVADFSHPIGYPSQDQFIGFQTFVNNKLAIYPPTIGTVTLDALDEKGEVYAHAESSQFSADTLLSRTIRLDKLANNQTIDASDSLYFSFYYQPAGGSFETPIQPWELVGNAPESDDSLILEFGYATGNMVFDRYEFCDYVVEQEYQQGDTLINPYFLPSVVYWIFQSMVTAGEVISIPCDSIFVEEKIWTHVWATPGLSLADWLAENPKQYFKQVLIPITDERYLRDNFQFRFRNYASLEGDELLGWNSNVDQWNIDYIRLATGRNHQDYYTTDLTFVMPANTFLKKYQAMPWSQFRPTDMKSEFHNYLSNISNITQNGRYQYNVVKNNMETIYSQNPTNENIQPYQEIGLLNSPDHILNPSIAFAENLSYDGQDSALFTVTHVYEILGGAQDFIPSNDTARFEQKFYNYYAYDDGTAEAGYTISSPVVNPNTSLAVRFTLAQPDQLIAIRMWFNHVLNDANVEPFSLTVWDNTENNEPGNVIFSQPATLPEFAPDFLGFGLYYFDEPIPVSGTFYIGFTQTSNTQLNIGFDQNTDAREHFLYKTLTEWKEPILKGSPMIRPVIGNAFDPSEVKNHVLTYLKIYPNPTSDYFSVEWEGSEVQSRIEIYDMVGKKMISQLINNGDAIHISDFPAGFYIVKMMNDQKIIGTQKLIKQ